METSRPSHESIAMHAYHLWEEQGRPEGRAAEIWMQAERELTENDDGARSEDSVPTSSSDPLNLRGGTRISNLDRELPPRTRRETREQSRTGPRAPERPIDPAGQPHHYLVLLDRAHLRIYGWDDPAAMPVPVTALDSPAGKSSYAADASDQAGQFPGGRKPRSLGATAAGGTTDERLPMQQEHDRRLCQEWADRISTFFREHSTSTWDYAAGPETHRAVLEKVSASARGRMRRTLTKDLVNQPPSELRDHFAASPDGRS